MITLATVVGDKARRVIRGAAQLALSQGLQIGLAALGVDAYDVEIATELASLLSTMDARKVLIHSLDTLMGASGNIDSLADVYENLVGAGRLTRDDPGRIERVEFAHFSVAVEYHSDISVFIQPVGRQVTVLDAKLLVDLKVADFTGIVQRGRLVRIYCSYGLIDVTLSIENGQMAHADHDMRLTDEIDLGDGIALVASSTISPEQRPDRQPSPGQRL